MKPSTRKELLPTPSRLFQWYEEGKITRAQWVAAMHLHLEDLLEEIDYDDKHPAIAKMDTVTSKRAAKKLLKDTTEPQLREVFLALAELDDFPPSNYLWNASQWDIPLHCFVRQRREPVFKIHELRITREMARLRVEHGSANKKEATHEIITLRRDYMGKLILETRTPV
ncbi:hypothetical protein Rhal01_01808 [Rubritalea halochordaticola]|uniref:Uncharacterized protein n=1 Tax=Rubritalea halochordaticola TaxID=714537 RepID=A0ABP9UYU8_9BACT